ncbi:MAG: hypothetical protein M1817_003790 [Caeruleum heppii]|nr:MAG: hypothetical protein M1817_003790 [Caeruleum heppii]
MVLSKVELESQLHDEHQQISRGQLRDDSPLDASPGFQTLCIACRRGDLKLCQEMITEGANINARDAFDYTPLILASLCGHYEVVRLLLDSGALCERDTFQGERCLYNALNNRIRKLLLEYDYSKTTDPLQPLASHITSLLARPHPKTSDITLTVGPHSFHLHKMILSARSPYFRKKLSAAPETTSWKSSSAVAAQALETAIRYLYLGEVSTDFGATISMEQEQDILTGVDRLSRQLEIESLWEGMLDGGDRRITRQRRTDEVTKGRDQLERWYRENVLRHKVVIESNKAEQVRWVRDNAIFADVLLRADDTPDREEDEGSNDVPDQTRRANGFLGGIPVGPVQSSRSPSRSRRQRHSTLYPVHRAMLLRSEFFSAMFSSSFREAQETDYLQIISVDCTPAVLEVVLTFLYTEKAEVPLELAVDVLFAADLLLIEKLKTKAAVVISTLGSGNVSSGAAAPQGSSPDARETEDEAINVYDVIRAGWLTRVHRLEEFAARYLAYRLEDYIDEPDFADLIRESASRIVKRQETDSIELLDDIRYYLSERFRLRFEDSGIEEMLDEGDGRVRETIGRNDAPTDEAVDLAADGSGPTTTEASSSMSSVPEDLPPVATMRTLDGEMAGDEFAQEAVDYQVLLGKIDGLLERLRLDA